MSLKRVDEPFSKTPIERLGELSTNLAYMQSVRADEAEKDKEVAILIAAVTELCRIQQDFSQGMLKKFGELNENQLKLISQQSEYEKSVRTSTSNIARQMYNEFLGRQIDALQDIQRALKKNAERLDDMLRETNAIVKHNAKRALESARRLERIEDWKDFLFYLSPAAVILDVIIRLILSFR